MERSGMIDVTGTCKIRIDKEGKWYYQDNEIINPLVLDFFCKALERDDEGRYLLVIDKEICYLEVDDTPFVVTSLRGEPETGLSVLLNTGSLYELDPETLSVGDDNVMYCTIPSGMKVRFSRTAYYMLANIMDEDENGNIILKISKKTYCISIDRPGRD
jgi:hypothetical protein